MPGFIDALSNIDPMKHQGMDWELKESAAVKKVNSWLQNVASNPPIHQAAIVLGALLNGTNAVTNQHRFGKIGAAMTSVVAFLGSATSFITNAGGLGGDIMSTVNNTVARELNAVLDELKNPNIEGIPIHADQELENSSSDVNQKMYIRESADNKDYRIDNTVPKLRTWTVRGYLMSNPYIMPLESKLVIKPSLIAQRELLQWFKDSRKPVWFKTHDNRFFKVLINMIESQYSVQSLNSLSVNLQLTEFKALEVDSEMAETTIMNEKGEVQ